MGIREALLLAVVSAICLVALAKPKIGLYGYVWFSLMRPDILAFVENKYPFSLLLALCTGLGALAYFHRIGVWFGNRLCLLLILLQIPIGLSILFAVRPELDLPRYDYFTRMIAVLLLIPILIQTSEECRQLLTVIAASLGVIALKFGLFGLIHGGVIFINGYGDMMGDNNFLALAFDTMLPIWWYCRSSTESPLLRRVWTGVIACAVAAVVMSDSRGGFIALLVAVLLIAARTQRKAASVAMLAVFIGFAIYLVRDPFTSRMETLKDVHKESSAQSRLLHAQAALKMWQDYPLLGVGFGGINYAALSPQYEPDVDGHHVAHNTYLQILVDSGIFAFLLYTGLLLSSIIWLGKSACLMEDYPPPLRGIPLALRHALIVFAVDAYFYSCHRMDLPYILIMAAAAWRTAERNMIDSGEAGPHGADALVQHQPSPAGV